MVYDLLRPGGELYLFEFHPVKWIINGSLPNSIEIRDDDFTPPQGYRDGGEVTYADTSIPANATPTIQWNHPLGKVVTATAQAGLRIESLQEPDCDVISEWDNMQRTQEGLYRMPPQWPSLPLMYVLQDRR